MKSRESKHFRALILGSFFWAVLDPACLAGGPESVSGSDSLTRRRSSKNIQQIAVTYSIEVVRDGKVANVASNYAFKKGDDVRFHVQSNTDGYMYILASGAQRGGGFDVLYPPLDGSESELQKGQDYHLPKKGVKIKSANDLKSVKLVFSKTRLSTEPTRGFPRKNEPSLTNTSIGQELKNSKEPSLQERFKNEPAVTITLSDPILPLGIDLNLSAAKQSATKISSTDKDLQKK